MNLHELPRAIRARYPKVSVSTIEPQHEPLSYQAQLFATSMVVVSPWGGISMLNWLMPPGGFELLLTTFRQSKGLHPKSHRSRIEETRGASALAHGLPCPDWDYRYHDGIPHITTLRYCTAALRRGVDTELNISALMVLVDNAVHRLLARHTFDNVALP